MYLLLGVVCWAIPADKTPITVTQSDGTTLTMKLVGDEFFHYNTTIDGYTVLMNASGAYEYARPLNDQLVLSGVLAHDPGQRTMAEGQMLEQMGKHQRSARQVSMGRQSRMRAAGPMATTSPQREPMVDYSNFRGLIILINYSDRQFMMDDPCDFYDKMVNEEGFDHFMFNGRRHNCTGSMHDYFKDQSGGIFAPEFDIVGPVNLDYACTDHNGTENSASIFKAAMDAADSMVDFSNYDNDGDGIIDMVYFLVAGYSANYNGNNGEYLWPHKAWLYDYYNDRWYDYDGVVVGQYASSTEIYGWESQGYPMPLGIGTMCHEFSHVLGLPDLYDTNYADQGQSHDPGEWDIMAGGGSYNYGRTPCAYSIWERYALGWNRPQEINSEGSYSLQYVGNTGDGLILRTPVDNEFFMLDNRQRTKWDAYLPGHGMLIARVDSTNSRIWDWNHVNADPSHNYYELLRAGNGTSGANSSDPFPGSGNVTAVSNFTNPNLRTWAQVECPFEIRNITEASGVITFKVKQALQPQMLVEDFEQMAATNNKNLKAVQGNFAKWNFTGANVTAPDARYCDDAQAVAMVKPSLIATDEPLMVRTYRIEFTARNSSSTDAKFTLLSSPDGQTWTKLNNEYLTVNANSSTMLYQMVETVRPMYYRLTMAGGHASQPCYVDNIKFYYDDILVMGDVSGDGQVDVADVNVIIDVMLGRAVNAAADVNADGVVDIADVNRVINLMLGRNE